MKDYVKDTIVTYNKIAERYQLLRGKIAPIPELERFKKLLQGKKVLDAGTGPGRDALIFAREGYESIGIDLSSSFLKIARAKKSAARFLLMDILEIGFAENTFNGIWCCAALSHLKKEDIPHAFCEFNRVLKPGGILFVAVKEGEGERVEKEEEFNEYPRFMSYFSQRELGELLKASGFQIIDTYLYNEMERFGTMYRDIDFVFSFSFVNSAV